MKLYTCAGTADWDPPFNEPKAWWEIGSDFDGVIRPQGIEIVTRAWPWWGTGLNGTVTTSAMRSWWNGAYDWAAALREVPLLDRNLIGHSHAGQLIALMHMLPEPYRVELNSIVTVCTPVRRDLFEAYGRVKCPWIHLTDRNFWSNRMQIWGALFDRSWRVDWSMPAPARTHVEPGIGHSRLLRDPLMWRGVINNVLVPFWEQSQEAA